MTILALSRLNPDINTIRCAIRKVQVKADPEEMVRQKLLDHMIDSLGYPVGHIAVEKELRQMPHLQLTGQKIPDRRADIICFGKGIHPEYDLYPLLLIECKAVKLTPKVINQVTGYNHFIGAYFIAVSNQDEMRTGWYDAKQRCYQFVPFLPPYQELLKAIQGARH